MNDHTGDGAEESDSGSGHESSRRYSTLPLSYFGDLRSSPYSAFETSTDSNLVYVNNTYRLAHIVSLIPVTEQRRIREEDQEQQQDLSDLNQGNSNHDKTTATISSSGSVRQRRRLQQPRQRSRKRQLADSLWIENGVATYLAMLDFNQRRSLLVPDLAELIPNDCDVYMTMDFYDTQFTPSVAGYEMYQMASTASSSRSATPVPPLPTAVSGSTRSAVSEVISILGGSFYPSIPSISSQSTSRHLDNIQQFPYFARTIPTNSGDAKALCLYLKSIGVTHFGVLYANDSFGEAYWIDLVKAANELDLQVIGASYDVSDPHSSYSGYGGNGVDNDNKLSNKSSKNDVDDDATYGKHTMKGAIRTLQQSGVKYFFGVFALPSRPEITRLVEENMIGWDYNNNNSSNSNIVGGNGKSNDSGNVWIFAEAPDLIDMILDMDKVEDAALAQAANGTATMGFYVPKNTSSILQTLINDFTNNETLINHYISSHKSGIDNRPNEPPFINDDNSTFELQSILRDQLNYSPQQQASFYSLLSYDAILTLGLAMCDSSRSGKNSENRTSLSTGAEIFESMKKVSFYGASGRVAYDPDTGTRSLDTVSYQLTNIIGREMKNTDNNNGKHDGNLVQLKGTTSISIDLSTEKVEEINPFIFPDGTTSIPPTLPFLLEDKHLVPRSVIAFCDALAAITLLMSLAVIAWTMKNRHRTVVRASQPVFLNLLSIGTISMSLAVFPLTLQDGDWRNLSQRTLDIGCMCVHWFFALGFSITFTAIISKMMRINTVVKSAKKCRRVTVRPRHVIWPMVIIAGLNAVILTVWTVVDPLRWHRIPLAYGPFGQVAESHGTCFELSLREPNTIPILILVLSNGCALLYGNYQCYLGRALPTEYNESFYIALTNGMMLEGIIIIVPLLFFTETDPTSTLIIQTILILVVCWSALLPTYLPKFFSSEARRVTVKGEVRYVKNSVDGSILFGSNLWNSNRWSSNPCDDEFKSPE